jgi:hypothetical protein
MKSMQKGISLFFASLLMLSSTAVYADGLPNMGIDNNGNVDAVWSDPDPTNGMTHVQAARYDFATGNWTTPVTLSSSSISSTTPELAVAPSGFHAGDAVAIWIGENGSLSTLYGAMKPNGGSWTSPAQISSNSENLGFDYQVTVNNLGNAVAIWSSTDSNGNQYIRAATTHVNTSNSWSSPVTVSGP